MTVELLSPPSVLNHRDPEFLPASDLSQGATISDAGALIAVMASGGPRIVFQPQLDLRSGTVAGYEALARFPSRHSTSAWFELAATHELSAELEAAALRNALRLGAQRPEGTWLALNISPTLLDHPTVAAALPQDLTGLEIELTEHSPYADVAPLVQAVAALRERGARIAIDDLGTAYSGLRRTLELRPDTLKIDRYLISGIAHDPAKAALVRGVVDFANHLGSSICAEGVETLADLEFLTRLGVSTAQGWVIGEGSTAFTTATGETTRRQASSAAW